MLTLENVENNLLHIKDKLIQKKGEYNVNQNRLSKLTTQVETMKEKHLELEESKQLLILTIQHARQEAKDILEGLVTKALRYLLQNDDISFLIEINDLKNRTECDFYVVENGKKRNPLLAIGGGVTDIVSTVLRLSLIQAANSIKIEDDEYANDIDNLAPILLDEPYKQLSAGNQDNAGLFLRKIHESLDRQLIIVTHEEKLKPYGDKSFTVTLNDKVSEVISS